MRFLNSSGHAGFTALPAQIIRISAVCFALLIAPTSAYGGDLNRLSRATLAETMVGIEDVDATEANLANAAPDSLEGKLYAYQQARLVLESAVAAQNMALEHFEDLAAMTASQVGLTRRQFHARKDDAANAYNALQQGAEAAQIVAQAALENLCDKVALSNDAMMELHAMLGL